MAKPANLGLAGNPVAWGDVVSDLRQVRLLIDSLVALAVVAVVGVFFLQQRSGEQTLAQEEQVRANLALLHERTAFHGALRWGQMLEKDELPITKFPVEVLPEWFGGLTPSNVIAADDGQGGARPWLDVAPTDDFSEHPPDPVIVRPGQAGFWYNPNTGVFRARTPLEAGDALTLARYNRLNDTSLAALPRDTDPARRPLAYSPGKTPGAALAHGGESSEPVQQVDVDAMFAPAGFEFDFEWEEPVPTRANLGTPDERTDAEAAASEDSRPSLLTR
ncbi:MAG: hypothetical protein AAGH92_00575 [Planctomycetota bacterium]